MSNSLRRIGEIITPLVVPRFFFCVGGGWGVFVLASNGMTLVSPECFLRKTGGLVL